MTTSATVRYHLSGTFLEACDCQTLCPCWVGQPPDQNVCNGLFAWLVDEGTLAGRDVGGLKVISVSHHEGNRANARQQVAVFVDGPNEVLDDATLGLVVRIFSGQGGGPLAGLGGLLGQLVNGPSPDGNGDLGTRVRRSITIEPRPHGGFDVQVTQPGQRELVDVTTTALIGECGLPMQIGESALSRTLGAPVTIGRTDRFSLYVPGFSPELWLDLDLQARSATTGAFRYDADGGYGAEDADAGAAHSTG